jgi:hypothetical protein
MWGVGLLIALSMMQNPSRDVIRRCLTPPGPCPEAQQQIYGDEHYPVAEPIDVPAVQEPSGEPPNGPACMTWPCEHERNKWCRPVTDNNSPADAPNSELCYDSPPSEWTCADKSRILLTAENGTKHCIKFPGAR